jgi:hypothetical protein
MTIDTWFEWCRQNSYFSCFMPISMSYGAYFSVPVTISSDCDHNAEFERLHKNSCFSCFLPPFSWAIAHSFRFLGQFLVIVTTETSFEWRRQTHIFHVCCPFSWAIAYIFRFPIWFPVMVTTDTWFDWLYENSCFLCFVPPFSWAITHIFSVPGTISCNREHRYRVWGASPKLAFFMFSAHFRWL